MENWQAQKQKGRNNSVGRRRKKICASFTVALQTAEVMATEHDKWLRWKRL